MADYSSASDTNKSLLNPGKYASETDQVKKKKKKGFSLGEVIGSRLSQWKNQSGSSQTTDASRRSAIEAAISNAKKRNYK